MIFVKIALVCHLIIPTSPGDGTIYARCEAVMTPGAPVEESSGVVVIDYLGPVEEKRPGEREG